MITWPFICVLMAFIIYLMYNGLAIRSFGIPYSLSNTYYLFQNKKKWMRILFPIMMVLVVALLLPAWLEISAGNNLQFLAFFAAAGLLFTGSAPAFMRSNLENKVHTYSAIAAAIFSLLWVIFAAKVWWVILVWLALVTLIAILTKSIKSAPIYWLETIAFMSTFMAILMYYPF